MIVFVISTGCGFVRIMNGHDAVMTRSWRGHDEIMARS